MNLPDDKYSYDNKGKLYYILSNNHDNIFLDIKIEDPAIQNRILKEGLTVWINMDGKTLKILGLRFPIGSQYVGGLNRSGLSENKINSDGSLITPLSLANTIELIGFTSEEIRRFPSENADSFNGSVKYNDEGILFYIMKMPISKLPVRNSKEGDGTMPFNFGIEYGAPPSMNSPGGPGAPAGPSGGRSQGGSSGGSRSGGSASGSRGMGGGRPGAGSGSSQNVMPPVLFWIKNISLATGK